MNFVSRLLLIGAAAAGFSSSAQAVCVGNCGTLGANGDITASPLGGNYNWVSTDGGIAGGGSLGLGSETTGSRDNTGSFTASAGSILTFYFNYATSDGAGFADYAWSQLQTAGGASVATLFTARTTLNGNTVPGFGLSPPLATLIPPSTPIVLGSGIAGGPVWAPLGGDSGQCWDVGCGYTGWIQATYTIAIAGTYRLAFGVTNWDDNAYDSGLAYAGVFVDGNPIGVPEPGTLALLGLGLAGLGLSRRRRAN